MHLYSFPRRLGEIGSAVARGVNVDSMSLRRHVYPMLYAKLAYMVPNVL